jgi:ketosteroid isomerase-like protein
MTPADIRNEAVRRLFEAFEGEDEAFRAALHPEIEWHNVEANRKPSRGIDETLSTRSEWFDTWDEHSLELDEVIEDGADVVLGVHIRARGRGSGVETDGRYYAQMKVRDGKVVYVYEHDDRAAALTAAGLAG